MHTEACMNKEEGGHTRGVFNGFGLYWWMEVKQWNIQTRLPSTASPNDGHEVVGLQYLGHYSDLLSSYKDVEASIPSNSQNMGPLM